MKEHLDPSQISLLQQIVELDLDQPQDNTNTHQQDPPQDLNSLPHEELLNILQQIGGENDSQLDLSKLKEIGVEDLVKTAEFA